MYTWYVVLSYIWSLLLASLSLKLNWGERFAERWHSYAHISRAHVLICKYSRWCSYCEAVSKLVHDNFLLLLFNKYWNSFQLLQKEQQLSFGTACQKPIPSRATICLSLKVKIYCYQCDIWLMFALIGQMMVFIWKVTCATFLRFPTSMH